MPSRNSPSPSPPPAVPQAASTEPGPRAVALKKIYTSALQSTLKSNSYPNFASCFPTPATYCPTALEGVWRQLNSRLEEECQKDFEKILEERKAVDGLNGLDLLVSQATERKNRAVDDEEPMALHTLTAQQLGEARMYAFLTRSRAELEIKLSTTRQDNQNIMNAVQAQKREIEELVTGLEKLVEDLEGVVKSLEHVDHEEMRRDIFAIEQEINAPR